MLEVSEAANRIYLLSNQPPRRNAIIRDPEGVTSAYGIRAHNPLGQNWRTVYEQLENLAEIQRVVENQEARTSRADVEFDLIADGYTFWFAGPGCCELPKAVTDIQKPVVGEVRQA